MFLSATEKFYAIKIVSLGVILMACKSNMPHSPGMKVDQTTTIGKGVGLTV